MQAFESFIGSVNGVVWSMALVVILVAVGIFFTILTKGMQFRRIGDMFKLLAEKPEDDKGESISSFESFATTVGARVGMGNIAGVATAIFFGGPGAVVWMWITSILGAATSIIECSLANAYKTRNQGEYIGGPQYYMEKALKFKPLAIIFAIATIIGPGLLMPPIQTQSVAKSIEDGFGVNYYVVGVVLTAITAVAICGGIQRISKWAGLLAPIMTIGYLLFGIIVFFMYIDKVPETFAVMFKSAFGKEQMFAGIVGAMIAWGVKRGLFSNEAGQGSGPIVSAASECSHPVKQGLVQGLSVYIDTLVVCSVSGVTILLTGLYNVTSNDAGTELIHEGIPGVEYGILWMQTALNSSFGGTWAGKVLAIFILLFVFTTLMAYYYQAESNVRYLFKENRGATWGFRVIYIVGCILGIVVSSQAIWSMGDTGAGLMAWTNIIAIVALSAKGYKLVQDYDKQRKAGLDPMFDPAILGIEDEEKIWEKYKAKKQQYIAEGKLEA